MGAWGFSPLPWVVSMENPLRPGSNLSCSHREVLEMGRIGKYTENSTMLINNQCNVQLTVNTYPSNSDHHLPGIEQPSKISKSLESIQPSSLSPQITRRKAAREEPVTEVSANSLTLTF